MKASNLLPVMAFSFFTLEVYSTPAHAYQYGDYCRMTQDETMVCASSEREWYDQNGHEPQPEWCFNCTTGPTYPLPTDPTNPLPTDPTNPLPTDYQL
jgi:hypothetical protein